MSDGGIQKGYTFWATIRIKGKGGSERMSKEQLQVTMTKIRDLLDQRGGDVVHCMQSDKETPTLLTEMRHSPKFREKKKK